jgi:hypothetical protein
MKFPAVSLGRLFVANRARLAVERSVRSNMVGREPGGCARGKAHRNMMHFIAKQLVDPKANKP